jgi:hypothetical protein
VVVQHGLERERDLTRPFEHDDPVGRHATEATCPAR